MIKRRGLPRRGCVALRTIMREVARHVIGIRRILKISRMARIAIHRRAGIPRLTIQRVALGAGYTRVRSRQRKSRQSVIETRGLPCAHAMTYSAIVSEISRRMVHRSDGRNKVRLVA